MQPTVVRPLIAAALIALASPLVAQQTQLVRAQSSAAVPDTPLEFFGFRAGAKLAELTQRVREMDGGRLRCDRAKTDERVMECRATLTAPDFGGPVELWVSVIDSTASVLTVSGDVGGDQLDRWRSDLERRYGRVGATVQGPQWMMQWVRRGRMIRLTWRIQQREKVASVSLVDGHVLDGWRAPRSRAR